MTPQVATAATSRRRLPVRNPSGMFALRHGKDFQCVIESLDDALSERQQGHAVLHAFGDDGVSEDLCILRQPAQPGRQVDGVSDRGVVEPALVADCPDRHRSHRDTDPKADRVAARAPFGGKRLHRDLQVDRDLNGTVRRPFARNRRVDEDHDPVAGKVKQRRLMARRDGADGFVVFAQHGHDDFGFRARGEGGEAAQIAKHHDDVAPLPVEQPVRVLDQFRDLRREELLQPVDPLRFLLRGREFQRHFVEANCELLQFVATGDHDRGVELPMTDPLDALLQLLDRPGHAVRAPIGERKRNQHAEHNQNQRAPHCGAYRCESFQRRLHRNHRPAGIAGVDRKCEHRLAVVAGHDRGTAVSQAGA